MSLVAYIAIEQITCQNSNNVLLKGVTKDISFWFAKLHLKSHIIKIIIPILLDKRSFLLKISFFRVGFLPKIVAFGVVDCSEYALLGKGYILANVLYQVFCVFAL